MDCPELFEFPEEDEEAHSSLNPFDCPEPFEFPEENEDAHEGMPEIEHESADQKLANYLADLTSLPAATRVALIKKHIPCPPGLIDSSYLNMSKPVTLSNGAVTFSHFLVSNEPF